MESWDVALPRKCSPGRVYPPPVCGVGVPVFGFSGASVGSCGSGG